jgi:3-methyladenine DNA glycosylase AlkD
VIGYACSDIGEALTYMESFIPKITNWAVCDSFAGSLKITRQYPEQIWRFLLRCFESEHPYRLRFATVMLLNYYVDEIHLNEALSLMNNIQADNYYVKMAIAWAISAFFVRLPKQTMPFLLHNNLDDFTYNKTLQKIRESNIPTPEVKALIKTMKRG